MTLREGAWLLYDDAPAPRGIEPLLVIDMVQRIPDRSMRSLMRFLQAPSTEPLADGQPLSQVFVISHTICIALEIAGDLEQYLAPGTE